jgi:hypothetical protein
MSRKIREGSWEKERGVILSVDREAGNVKGDPGVFWALFYGDRGIYYDWLPIEYAKTDERDKIYPGNLFTLHRYKYVRGGNASQLILYGGTNAPSGPVQKRVDRKKDNEDEDEDEDSVNPISGFNSTDNTVWGNQVNNETW